MMPDFLKNDLEKLLFDIAKQGVALMEDHNKHTTDEEQKQYLLLLVKDC